MSRRFSSFVAFLIALNGAVAQQPNTPFSDYTVAGTVGTTFPITGAQLPRGFPSLLNVNSTVLNTPFLVFAAPTMNAAGYPVLGGQYLDVNIGNGGFVVFDGFANPGTYNTGPVGAFQASIIIPTATPIGTSVATQALVATPTLPVGSTLSAATQADVVVGSTTLTLTPPQNGGSFVNLAAYGMTFPYYGQVYSQLWVNEDGCITFTGATTFFSPGTALGQFQSGLPRIAPMWADLEQQYAPGTITITFANAPVPVPTITVSWTNMAEWNNVGGLHSFSVVLNAATGDITFMHPGSNNGMITPMLVGISPGQGVLPASGIFGPQTNLSLLSTTNLYGAPYQAIFEMFSGLGVTVPGAGAWDLTGSTLSFMALGVPGLPTGYFAL